MTPEEIDKELARLNRARLRDLTPKPGIPWLRMLISAACGSLLTLIILSALI